MVFFRKKKEADIARDVQDLRRELAEVKALALRVLNLVKRVAPGGE